FLALATVDQGIGESLQVARGGPHGGRAQDGGVEAHDVLARLDHGVPPGLLDVAQHVDPQRAVVVGGAKTAVDFGRGEDKTAPFGEIDDLFEQVGVGRGLGIHHVRLPDYVELLSRTMTWLANSRPRGASVTRPSLTRTRWLISSSESNASTATPRRVRSDSESRSNCFVAWSSTSSPPRGCSPFCTIAI